VGVGQSETEIAEIADTVVFAVQPGSGDSLQFMKAGIVEIPDVALVTKADLGAIADRAKRDLRGALRIVPGGGDWQPPVLLVSATTGQGIDATLEAIARHWAYLAPGLAARRAAQDEAWLARWVREEFGRRGATRLGTGRLGGPGSPFRRLARLGTEAAGPARP
jgi:LAO/AO transport system kinase